MKIFILIHFLSCLQMNEELEGGIAEIEQIVDMNIKEEVDDGAEIPEAGMQEEEEIFDMDIEGAAEDRRGCN